jgi:hypothetical protein
LSTKKENPMKGKEKEKGEREREPGKDWGFTDGSV